MNIAIIPARGGSKRIKGKNIKTFCGKPMIAWSIESALKSKIFDKVIVSTDNDEIGLISRQYGALTPFERPSSISDDFTTTSSVIRHAINDIDPSNNKINSVCCIYATAPFITAEDIKRGFSEFKSGNWDYVFSATEFASNIFRAFEILDNGGLRMFSPENFLKRTQDLPNAYHDAAQFYWASPETWNNEKPIFSDRSLPILIPRWRVHDIDTYEDWDNAELIAPFVFKKIQEH